MAGGIDVVLGDDGKPVPLRGTAAGELRTATSASAAAGDPQLAEVLGELRLIRKLLADRLGGLALDTADYKG